MKMEAEIFATFQEDIRQRFLICHQLPEDLAEGAVNLLSVLSDIPLRTLDALHLSIARDLASDTLATADHIMASAAKAMGISVVKF
jgi:predicted nucleic acid-binding protein